MKKNIIDSFIGERTLPSSFKVDHTTLKPGLYPREIYRFSGEEVIAWDFRMTEPAKEEYIQPEAMHVLEHVLATHFRSSYPFNIVYVGPMGCMTGFYFMTRGLTEEQVWQLLYEASTLYLPLTTVEDVPHMNPKDCGNYKFRDLEKANDAFELIIKTYKEHGIKHSGTSSDEEGATAI